MPRAEYIRLNAAAKLAHPLDAACCARVVEAVLKHALFMQQQLPCPYDQLFHEISMANARRRPSGGVRKAMRLVSAMQALLDQLPEALLRAGSAVSAQGESGLVAALLLGSSVGSPRLVYLLRFDCSCADGVIGPPDITARARDACRRVLRALMTQCSPLSGIDPGACCRLHLLLLAPPDARLPTPTFQPRPGFILKLRRAHVACINASDAPSSARSPCVTPSPCQPRCANASPFPATPSSVPSPFGAASPFGATTPASCITADAWDGLPIDGLLVDGALPPDSIAADGSTRSGGGRRRGPPRQPRGACFVLESSEGSSAADEHLVDAPLMAAPSLVLRRSAPATDVYMADEAADLAPDPAGNYGDAMDDELIGTSLALGMIWFQSTMVIKGFRAAL